MSEAEKGARDDKGRFTRGNPGGSGNPFARQVAALRSALVNKVTLEDIEDIVIILLLKAKQGDLAAVKLLFTYVLGKPTEQDQPVVEQVDVCLVPVRDRVAHHCALPRLTLKLSSRLTRARR